MPTIRGVVTASPLGCSRHVYGGWTCSETSETLQQFEVTRDQRVLLGSTPALQLAFSGECGRAIRQGFGVRQRDRRAPRGEAAADACVVPRDSLLDVSGLANVAKAP